MKYAFLAAALLSAGGATAAEPTCDRDCLLQTLTRFLDGVVKHDPNAAPLAANYRGTENAVEVKAGDGTWKSVTALGKVQRRYADPVSQQVGYFGTVEEAGGSAIVAVRLRVAQKKVTEAEWVIGRKGAPIHNLEGFLANPPPPTTVPADKRTTRAQILAASDSYFEGMEKEKPAHVMQHKGCYRVENGTWMLGDLHGPGSGGKAASPEELAGAVAAAGQGGSTPRPLGNGVTVPRTSGAECITGFEHAGSRSAVTNRHYFADVEAGMGWGTVVFERTPGTKRADGSPLPWLYLTEIFRIEDGRIRGIYAAMDYLPAEIKSSGWPADK